MTDPLLDRVQQLLDEESWTSASVADFTVSWFESLDPLIGEITESEAVEDVRNLCDERLRTHKQSVTALYLGGLLAWKEQLLEEADFLELISIVYHKNKLQVVEYLCVKMLSYGENKGALEYLAERYHQAGQDEEHFEILERLVKVDHTNPLVAFQVAKMHEEQGRTNEAISFYKKAIFRFIYKKQFQGIQESWIKLLALDPRAYDVFNAIILKVENNLDANRTVDLIRSYYTHLRGQEQIELAISQLKKLLVINPKDNIARRDLVEAYRQKYTGHSRLDEVLKISCLAQNWRPITEALESFDKHISLDKGKFVYHRNWGVGRVRSITEDEVIIDFAKQRGHKMALDMAITSLIGLDRNHIWVLKATMPKDKLRAKIKTEMIWALTILAGSNGGKTDFKRVKAELVPSLLTQSEWSTWSAEARRITKTEDIFGNDGSKADAYTLRSTPISFEEKQWNRFKGEENFFKKLAIFEQFIEECDLESEYLQEMYVYFYSYLKSYAHVDVYTITSYLLVQRLSKLGVSLDTNLQYSFKDFIDTVLDIEPLFMEIEGEEYRHEFLLQVKRSLPNWQEIYLALLPLYPSASMVDDLLSNHREEEIRSVFHTILDRYRTHFDAYWRLLAYLEQGENRFERFNIDIERIIFAMLHLVDISARQVQAKKELAHNKRIHRLTTTWLLKEEKLFHFAQIAEEKTLVRLYTLMREMRGVDESDVENLKAFILERYPSANLDVARKSTESEPTQPRRMATDTLWVTEKSYQQKQQRLKEVLEVEIPRNSLEIGEAIKKGDLKENAEYISGKEMQNQLQMEVGRLQKDLEQARLFTAEQIDLSMIGFGVVVSLQPVEGKRKETYTILGPWESNPDKKIISYQAPFAMALLGKKVGEICEFIINGRDYKYEILEISAAKF
ncbi:transcription elongation factor GreA [Entomospira entomophila]|uniref:Transcription elongation factor GreA n=1 Tax=Entomospira entomophila TaxID=2719988 RepID=A0A968KR94_9SPIO|nr:transcription elongation factor GreA [Entomospira entomophilus]NIZ40498.1 transcription elongation factor GreA [Entomospira entomophilus]WDI36057.1 transcription elongation factor GreA [Entomospira entomophilus]